MPANDLKLTIEFLNRLTVRWLTIKKIKLAHHDTAQHTLFTYIHLPAALFMHGRA